MFASSNSLKILLVMGLLLLGTQVAAQDEAGAGKALYQQHCAACHSANPAAMKGKPVDMLVEKMNKVKNMSNASGGAAKMQQVLQPMSADQIKSIAVYLNQMK